MTAKKCDRCGSFYDPYTLDSCQLITEHSSKDSSSEAFRYEVIKDCHPYPDTIKIDLCINCKSELIKWLNKEV